MRVTIVYESLMGNTRRIAEAIAAGIERERPDATVTCSRAGEVPATAADADLLVVGAPTHFLGLPGRRSRRLWVDGQRSSAAKGRSTDALEQGAAGPGVLEWLDGLEPSPNRGDAAAFDTRLDRPVSGSAAHRLARRLRARGYQLAAQPVGFVVEDMAGPLRAGEDQRAQRWGANLARRLPPARARTAPSTDAARIPPAGAPPTVS